MTMAGAARPTKPITPTTLTTEALSAIAMPSAQTRAPVNPRPRLRAVSSSKPSKVSGRTIAAMSTKEMMKRGARNVTLFQSC